MATSTNSMRYEHVDFNDYQSQPTLQSSKRENSSYRSQFRTDRIFTVGHEWYFSTREGINFGPYDNKKMAHKALSTFLSIVK
ncbi:MAG: DUF6316 family protein [Pseudomonadota bacterium]